MSLLLRPACSFWQGQLWETPYPTVRQAYPWLLGKMEGILTARWSKTNPVDRELNLPP